MTLDNATRMPKAEKIIPKARSFHAANFAFRALLFVYRVESKQP